MTHEASLVLRGIIRAWLCHTFLYFRRLNACLTAWLWCVPAIFVARLWPDCAAQRLRELGVSEVEVSSAGVSNEEQGNPIDYRAARLLREQGYKGGDISTHPGPLRLLTPSCVTLICC